MSGKKKLAIDDEVVVQKEGSIAVFIYSFKLEDYNIVLDQITSSNYDLKIDGIYFEELMKNGDKPKKFKKKEDENNIDINSQYSEDDIMKRDIQQKDNKKDNLIDEDDDNEDDVEQYEP